MPKNNSLSSVNQTVVGNDNIQNTGNNNIINRITNVIQGDVNQQYAQKKRQPMLEQVRNIWIKGLLEKSLYREALIELGLEVRPDTVNHSLELQVQMPDQPRRSLPVGTSIVDVFETMNGAMLILGAPGAGKTTMLLELARDCIAQAEVDDTKPIPVVLNLSSWSNRRMKLLDWLINELTTKYFVSKKLAQFWIDHDELLLLLDGLDEVKADFQSLCIQTINDFRHEHGSTQLVVCSRVADYEVLDIRLNLQGAVLIEPLTFQQIEGYFAQAGPEFENIRQILQGDLLLLELMEQPLMLNIMALTYQGIPASTFTREKLGTIENERSRLFDTYIQRMFDRIARTKIRLYSPEQTKAWLGWLAQRMIKHNTVPYLLTGLQPTWISQKQRVLYRVIAGLTSGLSISLIVGLIIGPDLGPFIGSVIGLIIALMVGLSKGLNEIEMLDPVIEWAAGRRTLISMLIATLGVALLVGLCLGLVVGLIGGLQDLFEENGADNLIFGFIIGLVGGAIFFFGDQLLSIIKHYALRFIISSNKYLPWRMVPFLDYCVDRIFLRRVGGGYIFIHRLLMEHFAAMYSEPEK